MVCYKGIILLTYLKTKKYNVVICMYVYCKAHYIQGVKSLWNCLS